MVVVIKPKTEKQTSSSTQEDLKVNIDPTEVEIRGIKNLSKGGVVIGCKTKETVEKLKQETEKKMGEKYTVSVPEARKPKVKIVGMKEKMKKIKL